MAVVTLVMGTVEENTPKVCTKWAGDMLSTPEALGRPLLHASMVNELNHRLLELGNLKLQETLEAGGHPVVHS